MDATGINLNGLDREHVLRGNYVHKDQLDEFRNQEEHFRRRYRFKRETVVALANSLEGEIAPIWKTNNAFSAEQRLCMTLRFYGTGTFQCEVGDGEGASQSTMCRIISKVTDVLANKANQLIKFSTDPVILDEVAKGFHAFKGKVPNVVGVIDGTQIPIVAPYISPEQYINQYKDFSIATQVIINHRGAFTNLSCRWPGSLHDQRVLRESIIQDVLDRRVLGHRYIIGDLGYKLLPNLMIPYTNAEILAENTEAREYYNLAFSRTRVKVECVIGQWKRKFPCLSKRLEYQPPRVAQIIKACGFLWNLGLLTGDNKGYDPDQFEVEGENQLRTHIQASRGGKMVRNHLCDYIWAHKGQN